MVTPQQAQKKYGAPDPANKCLVLYDVPTHLEVGVIPKRIYCNKDMVKPLEQALTNVVSRGLADEIKTWDGCFNIRKMRGLNSMSMHSWALAIDINAFENQLNMEPKLSPELVACFTDAGFDWGGTWKRKDGMHFQLANI